jgi:hypothetical protein
MRVIVGAETWDEKTWDEKTRDEKTQKLPSPSQGRSLIPEPELRVMVIKVPIKQTVENDPVWIQNSSAGEWW